jgi:hypothetical protein
MTEFPLNRRGLLSIGGIAALGAMAGAQSANAGRLPSGIRRQISAANFGAKGDGETDDTGALQAALDASVANGGAMLTIPAGIYRITAPLVVTTASGAAGNITTPSGISARGARLVSAIDDGRPVLRITCQSTVRFLVLEGLEIAGSGKDGAGLVLECDGRGAYLYNICLRDMVIEGCGGDGCQMTGNIFESQIFNSYFRDNHGSGAVFSHGRRGGILSAIHVFGCVFGQNHEQGAALVRGCYDVSFNGCYFLLNGRHGLAAGNGCTLLNGCGFENNHASAKSADPDNAAVRLSGFGTMLACGAYSIFHQTALIDAYATGDLVMIGCRGFGDGPARGAGLGRFAGQGNGSVTLIGCRGAVERVNGFEPLEMGGGDCGVRFGADWHSRQLPQLGDYRLWVDGKGHLRLKKGTPGSDDDGTIVGA